MTTEDGTPDEGIAVFGAPYLHLQDHVYIDSTTQQDAVDLSKLDSPIYSLQVNPNFHAPTRVDVAPLKLKCHTQCLAQELDRKTDNVHIKHAFLVKP